MTAVIDRLSDEDVQILKLARGVIRGHTCKVMVLERSADRHLPSVEQIRRHVESRLGDAPRLRKRIVNSPLGLANPVWLDDPNFDIAKHITPAPDGPLRRGELTRLVARLMTQPLPRDRPLWHLSVVEQLEGDAMAIIWRLHHSLADGTVSVRLASALLWDSDPPPDSRDEPTWRPAPPPSQWRLMASGLADRATARRGGHWLPRLRLTAAPATEKVVARELLPRASPTRLAAHIGSARNIAFASMPLKQCRAVGKAIGDSITVNDVVLAVLAGALRSWLGPSDAVRVKVPVSLHQRDDGTNVSNHDSFFFVDLPTNEGDPIRRVEAINRETRERKLDQDAETLYHLGQHPAFAHWAMSPRVFTFNVSNVPGPRDEVFVLGARLRELYSLAEVAQQHALRVAVISAADTLFFGLCADQQAVPDLEALARGIEASSSELLQLAP